MAKRRVIIRESDFDNFSKREILKYESISFTVLTKDYFIRRAAFFALKGKQYLADQYSLYEYPNTMLSKLTNVKLYKNSYRYWLLKYNEQNELVIRAGLRQPESRLGFATFVEKKK